MSDNQKKDGVTPSDKPQRGYDIARQALEEARARARSEGKQVGQGRSAPVGSGKRLRKRGWTGSGADPWDPQPLGGLFNQVSRKRGWDDKVLTGRLFAEWDRIVGEDVAQHATPDRLEEGILYVRASSTAWATQLRLMAADILRKIAAAMGPGHVRRLKIEGPSKPSWRKGPLHVSGRGPRDTYG